MLVEPLFATPTKILGVADPLDPDDLSKVTQAIPILSELYPLVSVGSAIYEPVLASIGVLDILNGNDLTCICETTDFAPGGAKIGGFPQSISTSSTKEENSVAVRIDSQALFSIRVAESTKMFRHYLSPVRKGRQWDEYSSGAIENKHSTSRHVTANFEG